MIQQNSNKTFRFQYVGLDHKETVFGIEKAIGPNGAYDFSIEEARKIQNSAIQNISMFCPTDLNDPKWDDKTSSPWPLGSTELKDEYSIHLDLPKQRGIRSDGPAAVVFSTGKTYTNPQKYDVALYPFYEGF